MTTSNNIEQPPEADLAINHHFNTTSPTAPLSTSVTEADPGHSGPSDAAIEAFRQYLLNPPPLSSFAEPFAALFASDHVHLIKTQIVDGHAETIDRETRLTPDLWRTHLDGSGYELIIDPVRPDGSAAFGAMRISNVGEYINIYGLHNDAVELGIPLVICGRIWDDDIDAFLFLKPGARVPAAQVEEKMREMARDLAVLNPVIEPSDITFPKLVEVPYWHARSSYNSSAIGCTRTAEGEVLCNFRINERAFLEFAEERRQPAKSFERPIKAKAETASKTALTGELFADGPPCLQRIAVEGVPAHTSNNTLLNIGTYARKKWGEDWMEPARELAAQVTTRLGTDETTPTLRSAGRKDYHYTCKTEPLCSFCDSAVCRTRKYGVGQGEAEKQPDSAIVDISSLPKPWQIGTPEIPWLIKDFIARGTIIGLVGEPGCGKTTISHSLAYSVAAGAKFAGLECEQADALGVDLENPLTQICLIKERLGVEREDLPIHFWGGWNTPPPESPACLSVMQWLEQHPGALIVVDGLNAFLKGSENDSDVIRQFILDLRKLTAMGATVIVLHHSGKAETAREFRGSSHIKAGLDSAWKVTNSGTGRLGTVRLTSFKSRLTVGKDFAFKFDDGTGFHSLDGESPAMQSGQNAKDILAEILKQAPGMNKGDFEREAGRQSITRYKVRRFIEDSLEFGVLTKATGPRGAELLTWVGPPPEEHDLVF
jgi:archaellum biogenesis ATPase FlaH